ncbi:hypothetical protein CALVIDRAFT_599690 [Calocera viscosa TUFC12733]|uniref:Uncharacterized protein n=1 Tax=Calocera viscosa (strain TUFC12733) TaxID=1330018 RepID=A0A167KG43_CALVF|nr:hypothetical protein CALVIDRAFT_599690 [Calocera viscosa TUFC12733]
MHASQSRPPPAQQRPLAPTPLPQITSNSNSNALPVPRHTMSTFRDLPGAAFRMDTQLEVTTVLANCGGNVGLASRAIRLWIESKQKKGRAEQDIITKVEGMERKYTFDASLHEAFHAARAETGLPRSKVLPPSRRVREAEERERQSTGGSPTTPTSAAPGSPTALQFTQSPTQLNSPQTFQQHTPSLTNASTAPPSSLGTPSFHGHPQPQKEFRPYSALQVQQDPQWAQQAGPSRSQVAHGPPYPSPYAPPQQQQAAAAARYSHETRLPYLRSPSPTPTTSTRRWSQGSFETITDGGGTVTSGSASMVSFATSSAGSSAADDESIYEAPYLSSGFPMTRTQAQSPRLRGDPGPSPTLSAQSVPRGYPLARTVPSGAGRVREGWSLDQQQESEGEASSGSGNTDESLRDWRAAVDLIEHFPTTPTVGSYTNGSPTETVRASTPRSLASAHPSPLSPAGPSLTRRPQERNSALHVGRPDSPLINFSLPPAALDADAPSSLQKGQPTTPGGLLTSLALNGNGTGSPVSPSPSAHAFGPRPRPPSGQKQLGSPVSPSVSLSAASGSGSGGVARKSPSPVSPASRSSASPTSPSAQLARPSSSQFQKQTSPLQNAFLAPSHSRDSSSATSNSNSNSTSSGSDWSQPSADQEPQNVIFRPSPAQTVSVHPGTPGSAGRTPRHQFSGDSVRTVGGGEIPPPAYSPIDPRLMEALGI